VSTKARYVGPKGLSHKDEGGAVLRLASSVFQGLLANWSEAGHRGKGDAGGARAVNV
jgi:hypothetical protein